MLATFDKDGALDRVDGDSKLLRELVQLCMAQCRSKIPAMEGMLRNGELASIASSAHILKGSLGNVGGEAASDAAAKLERAAKTEDDDLVSDLLATLTVEVEELFEVLEKEL